MQGFSPVWLRTCSLKSPLFMNLFSTTFTRESFLNGLIVHILTIFKIMLFITFLSTHLIYMVLTIANPPLCIQSTTSYKHLHMYQMTI